MWKSKKPGPEGFSEPCSGTVPEMKQARPVNSHSLPKSVHQEVHCVMERGGDKGQLLLSLRRSPESNMHS